MVKESVFAAIDVGTTKVCTILSNIDEDGGVRVLGVGTVPAKGLRKGIVVNIEEARGSIRESVKQAEHISGLKLSSAYVGISGKHVASLNNCSAVAVSRDDKVVSVADMERVLQSAYSIDIPEDRSLLHIIPRSYALDGNVGVKNPVGMHGFRLDVETHIITAAASAVQNVVKCIRSLGIWVEELVLEPLASAEAVLASDEMQVGIVLVDIGGGTTDIAIFKEGGIWHSSVLPVGGYQLTNDIAIGLGVPFDLAEHIKCRHGSLIADSGEEENPRMLSENGHAFGYHDLVDIIRSRVDEVLRLVLVNMPRSDYPRLVPAGLVLTGGTANLPGIAPMAQELFRIPVRVGLPRGMYGLSDRLFDPAYATSIGILVWGAKHEQESLPPYGRRYRSLLGRFISRLRRFLPQ